MIKNYKAGIFPPYMDDPIIGVEKSSTKEYT
jgi:hypothetical protein